MATNSSIEWTHHTFNPWRGCTKVSAGCANCYADKQAKRNPSTLGIWGPRGKRVVAAASYWRLPHKWNADAQAAGERRRVFCASMADWAEDWSGPIFDTNGRRAYERCNAGGVFYAGYDQPLSTHDARQLQGCELTMVRVRRRVGKLIDATPQLDWLLLTKRAERIRQCWREMFGDERRRENAWLLTSVEDQSNGVKRIGELLACRDLSPVLGLSCEPLLGPVDLATHIGDRECFNCAKRFIDGVAGPRPCPHCYAESQSDIYGVSSGIHWVIVGGESGAGARPCDIDWIRSIVSQCKAAGVPCFVKQLGAKPTTGERMPDSTAALIGLGLKDKKGGDPSEWPDDLRVREFPSSASVQEVGR